MIDWSVCRTQCQKSLPIKAASRSLPEWHRSLLQPGFPWQTSKAWRTQAPVPAEGTFSRCQGNWSQGLVRLLWLMLLSLLPSTPLPCSLWHKGHCWGGKGARGGHQGLGFRFCWNAYLQTLKLGMIIQLVTLQVESTSQLLMSWWH